MSPYERAVAIVGVGAILPDAPNVATFWQNILDRKYSISEVPSGRWAQDDYYDPDPAAPDKTYTKIGGWVQGFQFDWKRFRIPPKVAESMDEGQQWALTVAADALADYGYPQRPLNTERTAVIIGTAMGGELHYRTMLRISFPDYAGSLQSVDAFQELPLPLRDQIIDAWRTQIGDTFPAITEDSMPGELPNIVSGRVANVFDLHGPNYITDAACASSFAAIESAISLLTEHKVDAVLTGGVDRNMGAGSFVKFSKIGALSATGTRPFGDGADGFVMGEGAALFLLKRLEDAERDGDKIYAVIRGVGGASDGRGKGITAPNPIGQELAIAWAWQSAGIDPATAGLIEAHGTSTPVGDVVEVESLHKVFDKAPRGSIGLGSVKSNIGHLKAGAGAAGLLKATLALHHKILPPTLNARKPNPDIGFDRLPFYLLHESREWQSPNGTPRRAGVSAYGFGGTNFHLVLEEYVPGYLKQESEGLTTQAANGRVRPSFRPKPLRGILALGANTAVELKGKLDAVIKRVEGGWTPRWELPDSAEIAQSERLVFDFGNHDELLDRLHKAQRAIGFDNPQTWPALQAQGIFRGSGRPGKIAFLFPGQGSQYVNMGRELAESSATVRQTILEADKVMTPILGRPLSSYIMVDPNDQAAVNKAQWDLMQTAITQPAMLALDTAIYRLLGDYGFKPDMVMGHSLGEYAGLIAAGIQPFEEALEASAARGREMSALDVPDPGKMAAVMAPYTIVESILKEVDGYVVPANINSHSQCVIGGNSDAVDKAVAICEARGYQAMPLPVSHAFHTRIVAPASAPLRQVLDRMHIRPPQLPLVANLTGEFYPTEVEAIKDNLQLQIASPVQWVKGLETLYAAGVRTFVEVGPKKALHGFANDVFKGNAGVRAFFTNHPKVGELPSFNQAMCGLYAAGYIPADGSSDGVAASRLQPVAEPTPQPAPPALSPTPVAPTEAMNQMVTQAIQQAIGAAQFAPGAPYDRNAPPRGSVVITGVGLGLPGAEKPVMDPDNAMRILRGEQFVDLIPERFRRKMVNKRIVRVVKAADGSGSFQTIDDTDDVIKLAGRPGSFDLHQEYGVPEELIEALDITTQLAMAAGLDALREAGIPLVQTYKYTTTGKYLPDRWLLPEALRDETGVIFASAFPGGDRFADEFMRFHAYHNRVEQLEALEDLSRYTNDDVTLREITRRISDLRSQIAQEPYAFDRRFLFRILSMGHSQFAQYIGARGPNTQVNAACASTAQSIAIAEDWIRAGRCRRVIVIAADNVTGDSLLEWVGAGFLSVGAATTQDQVDKAALPFDKRRHGTIMGMGACALVVESEDVAQERGMRGIVELLSSEMNNSAFHGTRLDVEHIAQVMNALVTTAERRFGLNRYAMAPQTVFMSHETYTPARGGSASAEIVALRHTFADAASDIIIANTKGFTGHPMGVGIEDVIAVKILEHGIVPPVPNFKEVDPDLGRLNLSRGGRYPVQYAIHLAAGFGSQIAMTLTRRIPGGLDRLDQKARYQRWLDDVSGYDRAELEVEKRVLRIRSNGAPTRSPAANTWQAGTEPQKRTPLSGAVTGGLAPARMAAPDALATLTEMRVSAESLPSIIQPAAPEPEPPASPPIAMTPPVIQEEPAPPPSVVALPPAPPPAAPVADPIVDKVMAIVAQQTGYPTDMLDHDLDMEADLGIDTVKQAETFAAIRAEFNIPREANVKLRDYPTLDHVIAYVRSRRPDLATPAVSEPIAPPPAPAMVQPPVQPPAQPAAGDPIHDKVLAIIAHQTGYPTDMLELDLDMEADLGIDTVKQAETFAAIRAEFNIPRQEGLKLRDYPTINDVLAYVHSQRPDLAAPAVSEPIAPLPAPAMVQPPAVPPAQPPAQPAAGDPVLNKVLAIMAEQTGYPTDMLELDLDMEADLGIDTVKQAETFAAIRREFNIPRQEGLKLRDYPTIKHVLTYVHSQRPDLAAPAVSEPIAPLPAPAMVQPPAVPPAQPPAQPAAGDPVLNKVLAIMAEQTGYPTDMLELDLDMEADLGIDTVKQAETFAAIRREFNIPRQDGLKLRDYPTIKHVLAYVHSQRPDLAAPAVSEPIAPPPAPAMVQPPAQLAAGDPVLNKVLAIMAEQTGYPTDMLELDLDMEADLGIDTVKQAEAFAAIRREFNIPRQEGLKLRDYPTIKDVLAYVHSQRPDLAETISDAPVVEPPAVEVVAQTIPTLALDSADRVPRRLPTPMLRPPLNWCKPTGITLGPTSRIVVMPDQGGIGKALISRLEKLGATALILQPALDADTLTTQVQAWLAEGTIQGVYWLPALEVEPALEEMDLTAWRELNRQRVKNLYAAMRTLYESIQSAETFLITATRLGGLHGYGPDGAGAPLGGAVTGFAKAYKRERESVLVKAVDFEISRKTAAFADLLIAETLSDPGVVEVGYWDDNRYTITLTEKSAVDGSPGLTLNRDTIFLVTGAAGGITSAIIADLAAAAAGGIFYLLDLVPAPDPHDPQIAQFRADKEALKQTLIGQMRAAGERPTPAAIDKKVLGLERSEAALRAVESVQAAGGVAHYRSVNLLDGPAVTAVVDEIRQEHGRIDVLIHAGGIEISKALSEKDARQFDLVFDIKADGFFSLLRAAQGLPIGATVAFSSVAGRFGNSGQTDYSAANDLLCKVTSSLRQWRPQTRGLVIDWTAWGGIGMAARGSIPTVMKAAGIDMLPPEVGVPTVRRELTAGGFRGELVVAGALGSMTQEWDATGGLDPALPQAWLNQRRPNWLMIGSVEAATVYGGLVVETTLDPRQQPFLFDHAMDGTPLLPGVMGAETFAELATLAAPGYRVAAVENAEFANPFKFYRMQPQTLALTVSAEPLANGDLLAHTSLRSQRELAKPGLPAQEKLHFSANVRLTRAELTPPTPINYAPPSGPGIPAADIYRIYFHGPAYQVLDQVWVKGQRAVGRLRHTLPPDTDPAELVLIMAPRLIELCFQTAGVWDIKTNGVMALPLAFKSVTTYRRPPVSHEPTLYALVEAQGGLYNARVVDESGQVYVSLTAYRTVALEGTVNL